MKTKYINDVLPSSYQFYEQEFAKNQCKLKDGKMYTVIGIFDKKYNFFGKIKLICKTIFQCIIQRDRDAIKENWATVKSGRRLIEVYCSEEYLEKIKTLPESPSFHEKYTYALFRRLFGSEYAWSDYSSRIEKKKNNLFELLKPEADFGNSFAQNMIHFVLTQDSTTEGESLRYLQLAADQGDALAQTKLGAHYIYMDFCNMKGTAEKGIEYLNLAAGQGFSDAQYQLGKYFKNKDQKKAIAYFKLAADQGHLNAQTQLGAIYSSFGIRDEKEALKYYQLAVNQGGFEGQAFFASCYLHGFFGLEKNEELALKFLLLAAVPQRFTPSDLKAGKVFLKEVFQYYSEAESDGKVEGKFGLGHCYRYGIGVDKDQDKAQEFYQAAATAGHLLAKQAFVELEKELLFAKVDK